jgi:cytochrome c-type biogenesis protein CcmH
VRRAGLLALFMLAMTLRLGPAAAVQLGEALADPALEARARALSAELRCMVCQNQSIDLSDAELAHDLRVLVRERLTAGDSDEEVLDYVVSRYGEFVLLKPRFSLRNALLWGAPVLLLIGGVAVLVVSQRSRRAAAPKLSDEEAAELDRILKDARNGSI